MCRNQRRESSDHYRAPETVPQQPRSSGLWFVAAEFVLVGLAVAVLALTWAWAY